MTELTFFKYLTSRPSISLFKSYKRLNIFNFLATVFLETQIFIAPFHHQQIISSPSFYYESIFHPFSRTNLILSLSAKLGPLEDHTTLCIITLRRNFPRTTSLYFIDPTQSTIFKSSLSSFLHCPKVLPYSKTATVNYSLLTGLSLPSTGIKNHPAK